MASPDSPPNTPPNRDPQDEADWRFVLNEVTGPSQRGFNSVALGQRIGKERGGESLANIHREPGSRSPPCPCSSKARGL